MSARGSTTLEFAVAWPVFLIAVLGAIELSVWSVEALAARASALAGARAGSAPGTAPGLAAAVAVRGLTPFLAGARAAAWCPGEPPAAASVWVCEKSDRRQIEVTVAGVVPALVPLPGTAGLPVRATVSLPIERFS